MGAPAVEIELGRDIQHSYCGDGAPGFGVGDYQGAGGAMMPFPTGVRVWVAAGHTDMRRGMRGLALQVQEALKRDPHAGDLYVFRGRNVR